MWEAFRNGVVSLIGSAEFPRLLFSWRHKQQGEIRLSGSLLGVGGWGAVLVRAWQLPPAGEGSLLLCLPSSLTTSTFQKRLIKGNITV